MRRISRKESQSLSRMRHPCSVLWGSCPEAAISLQDGHGCAEDKAEGPRGSDQGRIGGCPPFDPCFQSIGVAAGVNNIYSIVSPLVMPGPTHPAKTPQNHQHPAREGSGCLQSTHLNHARRQRGTTKARSDDGSDRHLSLSRGVHGESRLQEHEVHRACASDLPQNANTPHE